MTPRPVEAVFFWRYLKSPFRAAYGRFPGGKYTKDFLQCPSEQWETLDRILGRSPNDTVEIAYRWPGGSRSGEFRKSAADNRGQLAWKTTDGAPIPWKVGDPAKPEIAIPGDATKTSEADAESELDALAEKGVDPWIVAVKLHGEPGVLYPRAYLSAPPAGLERKSTAQLPAKVREAMEQLPGGAGGGAIVFPSVRAQRLVQRIIGALERDLNVLLIGPPGTGKTVALEDLRALFEGGGSAVAFDPDVWEGAWSEISVPAAVNRQVISLVFHPSYSYEEFVAGLIPRTTGAGLTLIARPGPLVSLAHWATDRGRMALLILDEFNRGPAAAIFGDTLALLDKDKRDNPESGQRGATIERPYPLERMEVAAKYGNASGREVASDLRLPKSLWVLAALNSSDRSVAPLDAALRRRFAILQTGPDYEVLANRLATSVPSWTSPFAAQASDPAQWTDKDVKELALRLLWNLNERISLVLGDDFLLGHALLWDVKSGPVADAARSLALAFDERIGATLRLTFVDQDEALGVVLKAGPPPAWGVPASVGKLANWVVPAPELEGVATARLRITSTADMEWRDAMQALRALL